MNDGLMNVIVPAHASGKRIDVFLAECNDLEGIQTRSGAQKLLAAGNITKNGNPLQKNYKVAVGDILTCQIPAPIPYEAVAEDIPLDVVYEDADLLVVNKPRGLVVHPAAGHFDGTLVNALLHHCGSSLSGIGGVLRPGIVHRLDKDTSGLIVVAKNDIAHQSLAAQLASRTMGRTYNAICHGIIKTDKLKIDLPIGRHPVDRKKMAVIQHAQDARNAITYIEILTRLKQHTLVAARLETGRTHQIRVHLSHIGHPVLGDEVYSSKLSKYGGQVLHAKEIRFIHPTTSHEMFFQSDLPKYFQDALNTVC